MSQQIRESIVAPVVSAVDGTKALVNRLFGGLETWQVVVYSSGTTFIVLYLKDFLFQDESLTSRAKRQFFYWVKKIPAVKRKIAEDLEKTSSTIEDAMIQTVKDSYICKLPARGLPDDLLIEEMEKYRSMGCYHMICVLLEAQTVVKFHSQVCVVVGHRLSLRQKAVVGVATNSWKSGLVSGTVYNGDDTLTELMAKTYGMFAWSNPLHPDVFPDVRKMEAEVVRMCCTLFNGDADTCGAVSSGGTESILLAMLAYRNLARERGVKVPEIIVPITAHAAFDKAAGYFNMKITHIPVDEKTRMVNLAAMRRAINRRTCVLVASAPQFPHGIIDPVQEVAQLGLRYGLPVHVDCCLGGFLLPFMEKAGFPLQPFDFRVHGVTSISADTHKYGFAPKGSSVIMYRSKELRAHQYFIQPNWPGGMYGSPTFAGSRAGSIVAACWATLMHFGEEGYIDSTKRIVSTTRYITNRLKSLPEIYIFGEPQVSVIGVGSNVFSIYRLFEGLVERGWNLNSLQFPSSLHLCLTLLHTKSGVADRFVADVEASIKEIMKDPTAECKGAGAIYGFAQSLPDRTLVSEVATAFLNACYTTKSPASHNGGPALANGGTATPTGDN